MPITITADKADELPEPIRANAKEDGGRFVVSQLPDGWGVAHEAAYRQKLTKFEQDLKRRDERLNTFADESGAIPEPDKYREMRAEYKRLLEAQGKAPNVDELRKQIHAEAERSWAKKVEEAEKARAALDADLDRTTMRAAIQSLVAELGPKEGKSEVLELILASKLGIDKTDGKRNVRVRSSDGKEEWMLGNGPDGFATPKDYAANVIRTQHADLLRGDGASGAGAASTAGGGRGARTVRLSRTDLNGKAAQVIEAHNKAVAAGQTVEWVE